MPESQTGNQIASQKESIKDENKHEIGQTRDLVSLLPRHNEHHYKSSVLLMILALVRGQSPALSKALATQLALKSFSEMRRSDVRVKAALTRKFLAALVARKFTRAVSGF